MKTSAHKFLRGGVVIGGSATAGYAFRFLRNVFLAHLLTQADFGICVAMTTLVASALLLTDFGFEKLLIQERSIDDAKLQPVLASLVLVRTCLAGSILFILSQPLANLFGVPAAGASFYIVAISLVPFGFNHLDTTRFQKQYRFGPEAAVSVAYPFFDFVFTLGGAYLFRTYMVVPYSLVASAAGTAIVSHYFSERRYSLSWDIALVKRALRFGVPLVLGGLVILAASQADRIVVGAGLGVMELALYGAAGSLISAPSMLLTRIATSLFLPRLSESAGDKDRFRTRFAHIGIVTVLAAAVVLVPLMIFGPDIVALVFGARYRPPAALILTITLGQAAGVIRFWPNVGALARGDTKNLFLSNIFRVFGVPLALIATHLHYGLVGIAGGFAIGEFLGLTGAFLFLQHRHPELLKSMAFSLLMFVAVFGLAAVATAFCAGNLMAQGLATAVLLGGFGACIVATSADARHLVGLFRREIATLVRR